MHTWMRDITRMNGSCLAQSYMSQITRCCPRILERHMSHVSFHIWDVTHESFHIWDVTHDMTHMSVHIRETYESCHAYLWVMSHVWCDSCVWCVWHNFSMSVTWLCDACCVCVCGMCVCVCVCVCECVCVWCENSPHRAVGTSERDILTFESCHAHPWVMSHVWCDSCVWRVWCVCVCVCVTWLRDECDMPVCDVTHVCDVCVCVCVWCVMCQHPTALLAHVGESRHTLIYESCHTHTWVMSHRAVGTC